MKEAGRSAHFRLFIEDSLPLPYATSVEDILAGLEVNRADADSMLHLPEHSIDYYFLAEESIASACGSRTAAACTSGIHVFATNTVDQHELNHAYANLLAGPCEVSLLCEGFAEVINCFSGNTISGATIYTTQPWRDILFTANGVNPQARQFVRHLILRFGIERFLRFYALAARVDSANEFARVFQNYWNENIDVIWGTCTFLAPGNRQKNSPSAHALFQRCRSPPLGVSVIVTVLPISPCRTLVSKPW